jgi:hypothetical protein
MVLSQLFPVRFQKSVSESHFGARGNPHSFIGQILCLSPKAAAGFCPLFILHHFFPHFLTFSFFQQLDLCFSLKA